MGFFDKLKQSLEKTKIALGITKVDENLCRNDSNR